ncbi:transcriptional regulator [Trichoderma gamsii]|uniref:Transcriptional regulator n=1 Tax=Trichoderma gamsii TaxID=398673 RepID=A0A2P4ZTW4_9HYPO|nr:transcriptional regulator [Trichoderma gamsii]PON27737.1 transcriptional regulator [Trichoderma gamsii]
MTVAFVVIIGTCDTKLQELIFLKDQIQDGTTVMPFIIDVGRNPVEHEAINTSQAKLLSSHGDGADVSNMPRAEFVELMARCATKAIRNMYEAGMVDGIISAGGSSGTALAAAIMRDAVFPVGLPKLIVSTMASGDTRPVVGETDITLMHSVVDIAGLNPILRDILSNAGAAIANMALSHAARKEKKMEDAAAESIKKWRVGITMFGVTTPGVDAIRAHLESNYTVETYVFHAVGTGGRAMERLIREGQLDAIIDLTTTEICDHLGGGVLSAGGERLEAAVEASLPNIVSLGALDMINFGPRDTLPKKYEDRVIYEHNPTVTLVRTSPDECREIGGFIAEKLKKTKRSDMIEVWIPKGGVSVLAVPGGVFEDPEADKVLFEAIKTGLYGSGIKIVEDERDVNDKGFARDIAEALAAKLGVQKSDS